MFMFKVILNVYLDKSVLRLSTSGPRECVFMLTSLVCVRVGGKEVFEMSCFLRFPVESWHLLNRNTQLTSMDEYLAQIAVK